VSSIGLVEQQQDAFADAVWEHQQWFNAINICPTCGAQDHNADFDDDGFYWFRCDRCDAQWSAVEGGTRLIDQLGTITPVGFKATFFRIGYGDGRTGTFSRGFDGSPTYLRGCHAGLRDAEFDAWDDARREG
jgi:hypothetical protein